MVDEVKNPKKLFISCPMRERSDTAIKETRKQMLKIAETVFNQKLEVVDSYFIAKNERKVPKNCKNMGIFYLGESIKVLSMADYYIGIGLRVDFPTFYGCIIENHVAEYYNVPSYLVNPCYVCPDIMKESDK